MGMGMGAWGVVGCCVWATPWPGYENQGKQASDTNLTKSTRVIYS